MIDNNVISELLARVVTAFIANDHTADTHAELADLADKINTEDSDQQTGGVNDLAAPDKIERTNETRLDLPNVPGKGK